MLGHGAGINFLHLHVQKMIRFVSSPVLGMFPTLRIYVFYNLNPVK